MDMNWHLGENFLKSRTLSTSNLPICIGLWHMSMSPNYQHAFKLRSPLTYCLGGARSARFGILRILDFRTVNHKESDTR